MNIFGKKDKEEQEPETFGWDAIEAEARRIYPNQDNPKHYGTIIKWRLGGKYPLELLKTANYLIHMNLYEL